MSIQLLSVSRMHLVLKFSFYYSLIKIHYHLLFRLNRTCT